jgi:shikimate dehydrogenase
VIKRPRRLVLLGRSLGHTLSPRFQNAALRDAGLTLTYESLDIPASALESTLEQLSAEDAAGNVTIPYKQRVYARCDRLTGIASRACAVNTFWFERGELVGDNTDVGGFDATARQLLGHEPANITVGLLGAGGAAAAVLVAVERWCGCRVLIHNRTVERARELSARFSTIAQTSDVERIGADADLVVNATSVGLRDDAQPISLALLRPTASVFDLVYRPGETAWVREARARGHCATDGLSMLVEQGALAFEQWFGFPPNRQAMWAAVR